MPVNDASLTDLEPPKPDSDEDEEKAIAIVAVVGQPSS